MNRYLLLIMGLLVSFAANAQKVKNVIVMIPDGCSLAAVSTARWTQWCSNPDKEHLNIDPYLCGTVRTSCSNAPIGDSAPTTSCYMTGYLGLAGWVSTYPTANPKDDIYPLDASREYQPLATVMEAAKQMYGKSTGLVFTCEFPHATPADCSSHSYNRKKYEWIAPQQVHNDINVVIGGGTNYLSEECERYLKAKGWGVFRDNIDGMRNYEGNNMWSLFCPGSMPYELDRDSLKYPSLAEMTDIAIKKLDSDEDGFFLMVEGSQVDYAAHHNDPASIVAEFLAFDEAFKVALEFARKDGNTAVVIVPDHSNSGLSIGRRDLGNYSGTPKSELFGNLLNYHASCEKIARELNSAPFEDVQDIFKKWCGFTLKDKELEALKNNFEYTGSPIAKEDRKPVREYNFQLARMVAQFMTDRTGLAFTTNGHTGEDVFLAAYHPDKSMRPNGMLTNVELNHYLCSLLGMNHDQLDELSNQNFVPHTEVFAGMKYEIRQGRPVTQSKLTDPVLIVKGKKATLTVSPNTNQVKVGRKVLDLNSVVVYVDRNNTFYVPRQLREMCE